MDPHLHPNHCLPFLVVRASLIHNWPVRLPMSFLPSLGGISHTHCLSPMTLAEAQTSVVGVHLHALSRFTHFGFYQFWPKFNHVTILLRNPVAQVLPSCNDQICVLYTVIPVNRYTCLHNFTYHIICDTHQGLMWEKMGKLFVFGQVSSPLG